MIHFNTNTCDKKHSYWQKKCFVTCSVFKTEVKIGKYQTHNSRQSELKYCSPASKASEL